MSQSLWRLLPHWLDRLPSVGKISSPRAKRSTAFEAAKNDPALRVLGSVWFCKSRPYSLVIADHAEDPGGQSGSTFQCSSLQVLPFLAAVEIDARPVIAAVRWLGSKVGGAMPIIGRLLLTVIPRRPQRSLGSAIAARPWTHRSSSSSKPQAFSNSRDHRLGGAE